MKKLHMGLILLCSLVINMAFILNIVYFEYKQSKNVEIKENKEDYVNRIYDLSNYQSFSYEEQTFKKRIDKLYSQYLKDQDLPQTELFVEEGKINSYWNKRCDINVRKINVLMTKLDLLEKVIYCTINDDNKSKKYFDGLIEQRGYHEKLRNMSNFYAKFLPDETCELIHNTTD